MVSGSSPSCSALSGSSVCTSDASTIGGGSLLSSTYNYFLVATTSSVGEIAHFCLGRQFLTDQNRGSGL